MVLKYLVHCTKGITTQDKCYSQQHIINNQLTAIQDQLSFLWWMHFYTEATASTRVFLTN